VTAFRDRAAPALDVPDDPWSRGVRRGVGGIEIGAASARDISALVSDAERGRPTVLRRHTNPPSSSAIPRCVGCRPLRDLVDVALVLSRCATNDGTRASLTEVVEAFGYTREQLESFNEPT